MIQIVEMTIERRIVEMKQNMWAVVEMIRVDQRVVKIMWRNTPVVGGRTRQPIVEMQS
jgi:hypothetical protein